MHLRKALLLLLISVLVSGCASGLRLPSLKKPPSSPPSPEDYAVPPPLIEVEPAPEPEPEIALARPAPKPAPISPLPSAAELVGFRQGELRNLMGEPELLRRDRGVEVWQYANTDCVLFFFFYARDGKTLQVSHIDVVEKNAGDGSRAVGSTQAERQRLETERLESCVATTMIAHGSRKGRDS